jgi:hypothetical protein
MSDLRAENSKMRTWLERAVFGGKSEEYENVKAENIRLKDLLKTAQISGAEWPNGDGPTNEELEKINE